MGENNVRGKILGQTNLNLLAHLPFSIQATGALFWGATLKLSVPILTRQGHGTAWLQSMASLELSNA